MHFLSFLKFMEFIMCDKESVVPSIVRDGFRTVGTKSSTVKVKARIEATRASEQDTRIYCNIVPLRSLLAVST